MPQGDLFLSKVLTRIGSPGIITRASSSVLPCPFTGDPTLVALCPWGPGRVVSTALSPLFSGWPGSPLECKLTPLWFWVWAGFSPRIPQGNYQAAHPLPPGAGASAWPSDLCLSCVWDWGSFPFPALGSLRVQSTQYRSALRYNFQCFSLFLRGLWTLCFLVSLASSLREHLVVVCIWLLGQPRASSRSGARPSQAVCGEGGAPSSSGVQSQPLGDSC